MQKGSGAAEPLYPNPYPTTDYGSLQGAERQQSPQFLQPTSLALGPNNTTIQCPHCKASVKTATNHTSTTRTHRLSAAYCVFCCCCLPYCMNTAKNVDHYCPNCEMYLGTYQR